MKQKKIFVSVVLSLLVVSSAAAVLGRYYQLRPVSVNTDTNSTPVVTYGDDKQNDKSSRPIMTEEQKKQADAPGQKQPTVEIPRPTLPVPAPQPTPNAPKQEEVRETVEEEHIYYPLLAANDPGYPSNWAVQKVNAPAAWNISTGNGQTVIAVIDTGFALDHEDLKNNWYNNLGETSPTKLGDTCWTGVPQPKNTNNCDDDDNGYIDDWRGWNFSLGDSNPMAGRTNPSGAGVSHGTEVAGLAGAAGNNSSGSTTINWNTKIMPLQVLSDDGPGYTSDVAAAIYYAVDNGADVINMSLGGDEFDAAMKTATDYAFNNNVVVVAAAGNCGTGTEQGCQGLPAGSMGYPALNDHVIAVGASNSSDQRASFSSYGPGLDVVAPGSGTINSPTWTSTNSTSLYSGALYGTSYASPYVASLVSLIKSIRPNSSADDIAALLLATTTKLPAMNNSPFMNELGHGIINASSALTIASSLNSTTAIPKLLQAGGVAAEHQFSSSDTIGSGCDTITANYCTVWLRNNQAGYDRYLPYQQANQQGSTGWTWSGALLPGGEWQIRARQGDNRSGTYTLSSK
ncbi:S8 family serine peptidase [Candidatus Saccharibacteria bacterium]|nr:S8 family serine peptidase [Candidatus Saccharibacteria bacterium]